MNLYKFKDDVLLHQSNLRAEDDIRQKSPSNDLYETMLVPCIFVLALAFIVLAGTLINYLNRQYP